MPAPTRSEVIAALGGILARHPEVGPTDLERLRITDNAILEEQDGVTPLSSAILDSCFPRADTSLEYSHYTTFETLISLVHSNEWRLYWVHKRLHDYEYQTFCHDHGLDGYLETDPQTRRPLFVDMCRDLFYMSLTRVPSSNEQKMWDAFGDEGRGVRLHFRIQPVLDRAQLRRVRYKNPLSQTIVQELMQAAETQLNRKLVLMGISRIGAFYLPMSYDEEDEVRLLVKRFAVPPSGPDPWAIVRQDGFEQYLPLPINRDNDFCRVDLVRVDPGPQRSKDDVNRELARSHRFAQLVK